MLGRRGQFIIEYAILVGIVIGALFALSVYLSRALQGQTKLINDEFSEAGEDWELARISTSYAQTPLALATAARDGGGISVASVGAPAMRAFGMGAPGGGTGGGGNIAPGPQVSSDTLRLRSLRASGAGAGGGRGRITPPLAPSRLETTVAYEAGEVGPMLAEAGFDDIVDDWWVYPPEGPVEPPQEGDVRGNFIYYCETICDSPVCEEVCEQVCQPPVCEQVCEEPVCEQVCEELCDDAGVCEQVCSEVCAEPVCEEVCAEPVCEEVCYPKCEEPVCQERCWWKPLADGAS